MVNGVDVPSILGNIIVFGSENAGNVGEAGFCENNRCNRANSSRADQADPMLWCSFRGHGKAEW